MLKPRRNEGQKPIINFAEYFSNKKIRESATFCYRPSGSFYVSNGLEIMETEFEKMYPLKLIVDNGKGMPVHPDQQLHK